MTACKQAEGDGSGDSRGGGTPVAGNGAGAAGTDSSMGGSFGQQPAPQGGMGSFPLAGAGAAGATVQAGTGSTEPPFIVPPTPEVAEHCMVSGCPPELLCIDSGVCITPPPQCKADGDCAMGQTCGVTGDCLNPGGCRVSADCGDAEACRMDQCTTGSDCGQTEVQIEPLIPNLLILLDISTSMQQALDGFLSIEGTANPCVAIPLLNSCAPAKMKIASQAITQMTLTYRDQINWGLAMFPGDGNCGVPQNVIAPAPGNEDTVSNTVANTIPAGFTPIDGAVQSIQTGGFLSNPAARNYMLFISDGGETCNGTTPTTTQRIADMYAAGIGTFVVGFGGGVDPNSLNQFANAGGFPNMGGGTAYYQADSASALEAALAQILGQVVGCDFALQQAPDDPSMMWAFLDNVMSERDTPDGWVYDAASNQVSFVGAACTGIQEGTVRDIQIVLGCPEPVLN